MASKPGQALPVTSHAVPKTLFVILAVVVALIAAGAYWKLRRPVVEPAAAATPPAPAQEARPTTVFDPISPDRPPRLDEVARPASSDWVKARPGFQSSKSAAERGGIEPCATQEVDAKAFDDWSRLSRGQLLVPREGALDDDGRFTLVIHLHGSEPVRRELVESGQRFVLYAITLGVDESYAPLFAARGLDAMVEEVEAAISKRAGRPAVAGHLALSAWSAGFVGIEAALAQAGGREVEAAILIDGLHAPRSNAAAFEAQLRPFVDYAARAARGERFFFVSHSSIDPPDFASTTECAHYLVAELGGKPLPVQRADRFGLELVEYFTRGELYVLGYAGNDKADHCAQLAVLRDAYAALGRRWKR